VENLKKRREPEKIFEERMEKVKTEAPPAMTEQQPVSQPAFEPMLTEAQPQPQVQFSSVGMSVNEENIDEMIEKAHDLIDAGNIEEARDLYMQILSVYESIKTSKSFEEATNLFNRIQKLYFRLQIYT